DEARAAAVDVAARPAPGGPRAVRRRAQRDDEVARSELARAPAGAVPGDDARRVRARRELGRAEGEAVRDPAGVAGLPDAWLAREVRAGVGARRSAAAVVELEGDCDGIVGAPVAGPAGDGTVAALLDEARDAPPGSRPRRRPGRRAQPGIARV